MLGYHCDVGHVCDTYVSGEMTRAENSIKGWLLPLLNLHGMSVEELANVIGVSRTCVYFYLEDKARPTDERMRSICDALGVSHDEGLKQFTPRFPGRKKGA